MMRYRAKSEQNSVEMSWNFYSSGAVPSAENSAVCPPDEVVLYKSNNGTQIMLYFIIIATHSFDRSLIYDNGAPYDQELWVASDSTPLK